MILVIVFSTTLAGFVWAGLESSYYNAGLVGAVAGFFLGVALVFTVRLAARR